MSLTASLIREGIKYSKGGWTKTNSKPRSSGWLLHNQRKTLHKEALDLFLFSWLGFEPDEQCYFDQDILHLCLTITYGQRQPKKAHREVNWCFALPFRWVKSL